MGKVVWGIDGLMCLIASGFLEGLLEACLDKSFLGTNEKLMGILIEKY
jgi:hypothetical protein